MQLVIIMNNTIASSVAFAYYTLRELLHTVAIAHGVEYSAGYGLCPKMLLSL